MSDLQLGLVILGVLVVVGVYTFNRWQERQFKRRIGDAFGEPHADILIQSKDVSASERTERQEPRLGRAEPLAQAEAHAFEPVPSVEEVPPPAAVPLAVPQTSSPIDYACRIESQAGLDHGALTDLAKSLHALGKRTGVRVWNAAAGEWVALPAKGMPTALRAEAYLQLADRTGPVNRVQLSSMRDLVREFAEHAEAECSCPEIDAAAQAAAELDRFCAQVDVSIGCSVVPGPAGMFPGTKVRGLLESAGFVLEPGGRFLLHAEDGSVLVTVEDIEGHAFSPERLRSSNIAGLLLTLDVPRIPSTGRVFDRAIEIGRSLAHTLEGRVVDDNRAELTESGLKLVRQQVRDLHEKMQAQGIPAGGQVAARLFS